MGLFDLNGVDTKGGFSNLPDELKGVRLEPEPLPVIDVVADTTMMNITIRFRKHEAQRLADVCGVSFYRPHRNSYTFDEITSGKLVNDHVIDNEADDYINILFRPEQRDDVIRMFKLPYFVKYDTYSIDELTSQEYFNFNME